MRKSVTLKNVHSEKIEFEVLKSLGSIFYAKKNFGTNKSGSRLYASIFNTQKLYIELLAETAR